MIKQEKNLLFSVYRNANVWPKAGVEVWAKRQIFLEALFVCNNINTNLNKNFHTYLSYHFFKPLSLFFQISARSSLKKFENEKWPKAGYLPLNLMSINQGFQIVEIFLFLISYFFYRDINFFELDI